MDSTTRMIYRLNSEKLNRRSNIKFMSEYTDILCIQNDARSLKKDANCKYLNTVVPSSNDKIFEIDVREIAA